MEINTLKGVPLEVIRDTFNKAFSDYSISMNYSHEAFEQKFIAENIIPGHSAGAFQGDKLVGFILNGTDEINGKKIVFNAGTGVVPQYRGNRLTEKMYTYILLLLKDLGYAEHRLEVLADNLNAKHIYEKTGFNRYRNLAAFKGFCPKAAAPAGITFDTPESPDWQILNSFFNTEPTWQNNTRCVLRAFDRHTVIVAKSGKDTAGYIVYDTNNGRIKQFAVKKEYRKKGIGKALFSHVCEITGHITFTNFDTNDKESIEFFKSLELEPFVELIDMKLIY